MTIRTVLFLACAASLVMITGCRKAATPTAVGNRPVSINDRPTTNLPLAPRKPIAEMSWATRDDRVQKLGDHIGKAVILDFWATYCEPCKREIPHLNALVAKYGADNLHIVGLNVGGQEDRPKIANFLETTKIDYVIAYPEDDLTNYIFAERSDIPQTIVFDRSGEIVEKIVGFSPQIQIALDAAVEKAVATGSAR